MKKVHDVDSDPDYDNNDRGKAIASLIQYSRQSRIPIGMVYHGHHASHSSALLQEVAPVHSLAEERSGQTSLHMESVLSACAV